MDFKKLDWFSISMITTIFLLLVGCIIQIVWLRAKLSAYSDTQLSSTLELQSKMTQGMKLTANTLKTYSVILDNRMTYALNRPASDDAEFLLEFCVPRVFNVPHVCDGIVNGLNVSCSEVSYLVINVVEEGASQLMLDLQKKLIVYVMINKILYFADYSILIQTQLREHNDIFKDKYVIYLYTMNSPKNIIVDNDLQFCTIDIMPFFGQISSDDTFDLKTLLSLSNVPTFKPMHILAFVIAQ